MICCISIAISIIGPKASARSTTFSTRGSVHMSSDLPEIDEQPCQVDLDAMATRRVELESRLQAVERSDDAVALGTPEQQEQWREPRGDGAEAGAAARR